MRILHVVKTSQGARWAAMQASILEKNNIDVHVVLPHPKGEAIPYWQKSGATIHIADLSLPVKKPHLFRQRRRVIRQLIATVKPQVIHTHFVTNALMLRLALGKNTAIPRIFQVPGPLHMEHRFFRLAELATAGESDFWIASSKYIETLYLKNNISPDRLHVSYFGTQLNGLQSQPDSNLRAQWEIPDSKRLVGNINYMYPPKYYLGQRYGLKRHEDVITALGLVCHKHPDIMGLLAGGQWGNGRAYEKRLHKQAQELAQGKIKFLGRVSQKEALNLWSIFDCAVHVPMSENCGGVVEPLANAVPTIASAVGGLPEVVIDGLTGWLVPVGRPDLLADKVEAVLADPDEAHRRAHLGQKLVLKMFDVNRTALEIVEIYKYLLGRISTKPETFDSRAYLKMLGTP